MNKTGYENVKTVIALSVPAILSQLSTVIMQYIDTAMVGSLGSGATASVGLVNTTIYLTNGFCTAASVGSSVTIAHAVGAGSIHKARLLYRQSLICVTVFSLILMTLCLAIHGYLPEWLAGDKAIRADSSTYFFVYSLSLPFVAVNNMAGASIQCSGNTRIPGSVNILMCLLDVLFNRIFIFKPFDLGVQGAALGTALSQVIASVILVTYSCLFFSKLKIRHLRGRLIDIRELAKALKISLPVAFEEFVMCGTFIITTRILAPYGALETAVYALVMTAESVCYMPGFGIGIAATSLVGRSIGENNRALTKSYAKLSLIVGTAVMSLFAMIVFIAAPNICGMLTSDTEAARLAVKCLRIEMLCEPLFAVQLVSSGIFRGADDTLASGIINAVSMWGFRLLLITVLVRRYMVVGVWISISAELCVRGSVFFLRYRSFKWLDKYKIA
ncbi:MATE family efflux transporter [uncultured Ruminococcus sp.]|uniref:MATE family efflux transporter n=1 Tax=uncultured Ruminococcus sp. TaxID=165186 RepID=UPI0025D65809|nr:MATE family efflux transporter [uncultured Ruminococcus sp.]